MLNQFYLAVSMLAECVSHQVGGHVHLEKCMKMMKIWESPKQPTPEPSRGKTLVNNPQYSVSLWTASRDGGANGRDGTEENRGTSAFPVLNSGTLIQHRLTNKVSGNITNFSHQCLRADHSFETGAAPVHFCQNTS